MILVVASDGLGVDLELARDPRLRPSLRQTCVDGVDLGVVADAAPRGLHDTVSPFQTSTQPSQTSRIRPKRPESVLIDL